ncbi:endonuclease-reverse transcriptase [Elysia marginata]|uniref:Endonuclease-reverse transcriptase n=2 Tax=Elysia marginata TaxID=1093978 RepID=A0AAV4I6B2_9GAST|nr:endonuclease-reverse transcriptase [Elysia marginata]
MTRTYPGADIGSDHDLVLATFKLKLNSKRKAKSPRLHFDLEKLKDPNISETFRAQIGGKFAALTLIDNDVDTMANSLKEVLVSTAEEVLGRKRRTIQPWVTNEVLDLCDKRRELRKRKFGSNVAMENYQLANKAVRKKMKEAKEKWIDDQCVAIEQGMSSGKSKQAFSTLKMLTKTFQPKVNLIEDVRLFTDDEDIMQRWSEYCSDLNNYELQPDLSILSATRDPPETDDSPPIKKSEVEAAVKSLKLEKAPGVDNIPSELLKAGGEEVRNILTALCQRIWNEKKWPTEWTKSLVVPLPKKGNLRLCNNYRTISLD